MLLSAYGKLRATQAELMPQPIAFRSFSMDNGPVVYPLTRMVLILLVVFASLIYSTSLSLEKLPLHAWATGIQPQRGSRGCELELTMLCLGVWSVGFSLEFTMRCTVSIHSKLGL